MRTVTAGGGAAFYDSSQERCHVVLCERLWLMTTEFAAVHCWRPHQPHVDLMFCEKPKCDFRSISSGRFAVKHQIYATHSQLFRKANCLFPLCIRHAVGHDGEGGDTESVKVDDVVEAFDEGQAVLLDELTVAGFFEAAGLLAEEFEAPVKTFGETVFGGRVFA